MSGTEIFLSLLTTQLFVLIIIRCTRWLSRPLSRDEYELWTSDALQRLYYERLKKQFNRFRAQIPQIDSIVEHDEEYLSIADLSAGRRNKRNMAIGLHYLECNEPLRQWVVFNIDMMPVECLSEIYKISRDLDLEFAENIVYNV